MKYYNDNHDHKSLSFKRAMDFMTPDRLDIALRIIMLERIEGKTFINFYKKLYAKLLLFRNGAFEPNEYYSIAPTKNGVGDYVDSAFRAYEEMKRNGYDRQFFIPVNKKGELIDGAHRVAAAILLGIPIWYLHYPYKRIAPFCADWFKEHGFSDLELLIIYKKYCHHKKNCGLLIRLEQDRHKTYRHKGYKKGGVIGSCILNYCSNIIDILGGQLQEFSHGECPKAGDITSFGEGGGGIQDPRGISLTFIAPDMEPTERLLKKTDAFWLPCSDYVLETLNLNSLLYYRVCQLEWTVINKVKVMAEFISQNQLDKKFYLTGPIAPAVFCHSSMTDVYLVVPREYEREQLLVLKNILRIMGKVSHIVSDNFIDLQWEENYFTCYGLRFLSFSYITSHEEIFCECADREDFLASCKHLQDFLIRWRMEKRERVHYEYENTDTVDFF